MYQGPVPDMPLTAFFATVLISAIEEVRARNVPVFESVAAGDLKSASLWQANIGRSRWVISPWSIWRAATWGT